MATKQSTVDFILDQLASVDTVSARKMFGEYALYCNSKVVGLICDNTLFVKITDQGKAFVGQHYQEGHAYKGAKTSIVINGGLVEDREWLSKLIRITAENVSQPVKRNRKK
jgi:TfoX/Sxy family transcriptional regulator of competence genes